MLNTSFLPGAPNWVDVTTPDLERTAAFYGNLFGWEHVSGGPEAGNYGYFRSNGKTVAGVGPFNGPGAAAAWTVYFGTPDIDLSVKTVEEAGGSVQVPVMDVMSAGRQAVVVDPQGARFALWQARDVAGVDVVNDENTLCWTELYTTDADAAKSFYRTVFDWQFDAERAGDMPYTVVRPARGDAESAQGGIMQITPEMEGLRPTWQPYFEVADCAATIARAREGGARIMLPDQAVPGVGTLGMALDPFGAQFAVITSSTDS